MSENIFFGDTTYPHIPDAEDHPVLVIDAAGNPVLETCGSVKAPANYSFECVSNFVHCEDPQYEELQYLALGMATRIAQLESGLAEARKDQARYQWLRDKANSVKNFAPLVFMTDDKCTPTWRNVLHSSALDCAIDAAITEQGK